MVVELEEFAYGGELEGDGEGKAMLQKWIRV